MERHLMNRLSDLYKVKLDKTHDYSNSDTSFDYGELMQQSVDTIFKDFKQYLHEDTVFYDLGCGIGKAIIHIGLMYKFKKAIGIEICKNRYERAIELKEEFLNGNEKVSFINNSFLDVDLSDATFVYVDNTVFGEDVVDKLYSLIPKNCIVLFRGKTFGYNTKEKVTTKTSNGYYTDYGCKTLSYLVKD